MLQALQAAFRMPPSAEDGNKVLHLMRHGQTEMNAYLEHNEFGSAGFTDPGLYDTQLTELGRRQASGKAATTARLSPAPEVLLISPLRRTLQTAQLAFPDVSCPRSAYALARERIWLSSDIGTPRSQLEPQWPGHDFSGLPEVWWTSDNHRQPEKVCPESADFFAERVEELRQALGQRPEQCLAIVAHWGVLQALTGHSFANCELRTFRYRDLRNWKQWRQSRF